MAAKKPTTKPTTQAQAVPQTQAAPQATEPDNLNNPPKTEPVSEAERVARAEATTQQNEAAAKAQASDQQAPETPDAVAESNAEAAIAPVIEGMEDQPEVKERVRQALGNAGETPKPTMVNGRYVGDKKLNEETGEWEDDADAVATAGARRPSDIFDRIGDAFLHEAQRLVIEEIARAAGLGDDTTDLPEGMPTAKSTASLRTDVSGFGGYAAGGGVGARPVAPGKDGKAQVE